MIFLMEKINEIYKKKKNILPTRFVDGIQIAEKVFEFKWIIIKNNLSFNL